MAKRATAFLSRANELLLTDLVVAECVYVLESVYEVSPARVAELVRAAVASPAMVVADEDLLMRALELYGVEGLDFADAYLVACAELSGVGAVASFDAELAKGSGVTVIAP